MIQQFCSVFLIISCYLLATPETGAQKIENLLKPYFPAEDHLSVRKLEAGLTNENYIVDLDNKPTFFVRHSNPQNKLLESSLEREWKATLIASNSELAPKVVLYLPKERIMVSEFIEVHGNKIDLRESETQARFCQLVRLARFKSRAAV